MALEHSGEDELCERALDMVIEANIREVEVLDEAHRAVLDEGRLVAWRGPRGVLATAERWARKAPPLALAVEVRPHRADPHMTMAK